MRSSVLLAVALSLVSCAKKERRAEPEKATTTSPAAAAGVCGPDEGKPEETSCGEPTGHDCNASCGCEPGGAKPSAGPIRPVSEAKLGDRTRCLVTNTVFQVKTDSPSVNHDGKTYFFCCDGCAEKFKEAPAKFLGS